MRPLGPILLLVLTAALAVPAPAAQERAPAGGEAPLRIAALAPHVVEMLFLLGAGERIVATVAYADHPPAARAIPRVGDAFALSLETLLAARPDIVIAWGDALDAQRRERLETLFPELLISAPRDLGDVADELELLAGRLGAGRDAARAFRARIDALPEVTGQPLRVLPLVSLEPPLTLGEDSFVDEVLRRCGGENPFAAAGGQVIQLSREALLVSDVDRVLPLVDGSPEEFAALLPAGVALLDVDRDLLARPGPRLLDGAEALCAQISRARAP